MLFNNKSRKIEKYKKEYNRLKSGVIANSLATGILVVITVTSLKIKGEDNVLSYIASMLALTASIMFFTNAIKYSIKQANLEIKMNEEKEDIEKEKIKIKKN